MAALSGCFAVNQVGECRPGSGLLGENRPAQRLRSALAFKPLVIERTVRLRGWADARRGHADTSVLGPASSCLLAAGVLWFTGGRAFIAATYAPTRKMRSMAFGARRKSGAGFMAQQDVERSYPCLGHFCGRFKTFCDTSMTTLNDLSEDEKQLYDTLGAIGTKEKTLLPLVLEKYPVLLRAPEVRRRAGASATPSQLGRAAQEALLAAISAIPVPRDRLVAEAALCSTTIFEGKSVNERKGILDEPSSLGVSDNQYRRARERVLKNIVHYLLLPDDTSVTPGLQERTPKLSTDPVVGSLQAFSAKAAHMHFLGLGSLFMGSIQDELIGAGLVNYDPPAINDRPLFNPGASIQATSDLALVYAECAPHVPALLTEPNSLSPPLSSEAAAQLVDYILTLRRLGPYDESPDLDPEDFNPEDFALKFFTDWQAFNSAAVNQPDSDERQTYEQIIRVSGEAAQLISRYVSYPEPLFSIARTIGHKFVSSHYHFDEWQPLINGRSLHDLTDLYFDQHSVI